MAKLLVLALAFTAIVAFASAHSAIVTTTIEDENPLSEQCGPRKEFSKCQMYLMHMGDSQSCCRELQQVDEQCQCEAVKDAFRAAQSWQQQQQEEGGSSASIQQMKQKAQSLPIQCNLQTTQCQIGSVFITTTTTITEENTRGSQQCQNIRGRRFNQCQNFIQRQISGSSRTLLRQGQQPQGTEQCCNELQNVERECQCDAMQEVYRQAQQQQQQQQQGSRRGGQPQTRDLQQIVQDLRNECNLQVQQCRIPSAMF